MTDYYSRFFEICQLKNMTELEIISHCKHLFARYGIPEVVRANNGTQFSSEFDKFSKDYDFKLITSSPKYSQSNEAVEAAVRTAKNLIKKCDDINRGLLAYRTTPLKNGFSPAEMMFSRKIRSHVPILPKSLGTFKDHDQVAVKEEIRKGKQEASYNKRHRSRKLFTLQVGDKVWIIDMRRYGEILKIHASPTSYIIKTATGSIIRRNRWHLVPAPYRQGMDEPEVKIFLPEPPKNCMPAPGYGGEDNLIFKNENLPQTGDKNQKQTVGCNDQSLRESEAVSSSGVETELSASSNPSIRRSTRPRKSPNRYGQK